MRNVAVILVGVFGFSQCAYADVSDCGSLQNHYGPFDYRSATPSEKHLVERAHFTPAVEQLKSGKSSYLGADLSYTLSVYPNHSRALMAIAKLAMREKTDKPAYSTYSVRCWFDRAIRFRPEDPNVRMIYGMYLINNKKYKEALEHLEIAANEDKDNANLNYNIGLAYFELKQYEEALVFAHRAQALGFSLPGLKNKLARLGKWREPPPEKEIVESLPSVSEPTGSIDSVSGKQ